MTTPTTTPDDLSLRSVLDDTLKDFGVSTAPARATATEPAPQVDIKQLPFDRRTQALIAIGALLIMLVGYLWETRSAPPAAPAPAMPVPTIAPTSRPTAAGAAVDALIGYFDYANPTTVTALTAAQIARVIGQAGDRWRLVQVGTAQVWIAADRVPASVPADEPLPDLTPRRPTVAPVLGEWPVVQPISAPASAPVATDPPPPPPTRCAEVGIPGKMVSACGMTT
jgi:hypothetical protein